MLLTLLSQVSCTHIMIDVLMYQVCCTSCFSSSCWSVHHTMPTSHHTSVHHTWPHNTSAGVHFPIGVGCYQQSTTSDSDQVTPYYSAPLSWQGPLPSFGWVAIDHDSPTAAVQQNPKGVGNPHMSKKNKGVGNPGQHHACVAT